MNAWLDFLLSDAYARSTLHAEHLADLQKSGLTDATIRVQRFRTIPPDMIDRLLGFPAPQVRSAYLLPFPDPRGGFMDHIRLRVFPPYRDRHGSLVKYLGPRGAAPRVFFPLVSMEAVLHGTEPLWAVEGAKKSLAVAQLGLPAVGFEGIEAWHVGGTRALLPDFDLVTLSGRVVELVPDGDVRTNPNVERGALRFADALDARGARVRIVLLPVALRQGAAA